MNREFPCEDVQAVEDRMPPGPITLRVTGRIVFPTAGYSIEVRKREPQGANPSDLLLEFVIHRPTGPVLQVLTPTLFEYREEVTAGAYTTVTLPSPCSTVDVKVVH